MAWRYVSREASWGHIRVERPYLVVRLVYLPKRSMNEDMSLILGYST